MKPAKDKPEEVNEDLIEIGELREKLADLIQRCNDQTMIIAKIQDAFDKCDPYSGKELFEFRQKAGEILKENGK